MGVRLLDLSGRGLRVRVLLKKIQQVGDLLLKLSDVGTPPPVAPAIT